MKKHQRLLRIFRRNFVAKIIPHLLLVYVAGSRSTLNSITSVIDANFIYGSSKEMANKLRAFSGGLLRSNSVHRHKGMKDLLPPKLEDPDAGCFRPNKDTYCFMAGMFNICI